MYFYILPQIFSYSSERWKGIHKFVFYSHLNSTWESESW